MPSPLGKPVIGLLGGIGSGKSTVAKAFASLGCAVIDADKIAREMLEMPVVKAQLQKWWGPGVVNAAGQVDRTAVGKIVFNQPAEREKLEGLIHPQVRAERARLKHLYDQDGEFVAIVEDVPLLMETNQEGECDALVFVHAPENVRQERVMRTRGWTAEELEKRESAQCPLDIKAKRADYCIDNSVAESRCLVQVRQVLTQIIQNSRPPRPDLVEG